ncbi:MAG: hypothetical protein GQ569_00930 [Methylococcaceae bacterium]|nr:hypothetical protein [Methylococcaceae bacterium]
MNTIFFYTAIFTLSLLLPGSMQAAEYIKTGKKQKAIIKIESSQMLTKEGLNDVISMTLIAKDKKSLYEGQKYVLKYLKASERIITDSLYDEPNGFIFTNYLIQAGTLRHEMVLKLIKNDPMEFIVIKKRTFALQHSLVPVQNQPLINYQKTTNQPSALQAYPPRLNAPILFY